ncbi:hypothetical protein HDU96_004505 [Phlyctochytrium bullatum]|nr:hypothetical protein HDU96_004505 [Phlyctochytrium bullatum]
MRGRKPSPLATGCAASTASSIARRQQLPPFSTRAKMTAEDQQAWMQSNAAHQAALALAAIHHQQQQQVTPSYYASPSHFIPSPLSKSTDSGAQVFSNPHTVAPFLPITPMSPEFPSILEINPPNAASQQPSVTANRAKEEAMPSTLNEPRDGSSWTGNYSAGRTPVNRQESFAFPSSTPHYPTITTPQNSAGGFQRASPAFPVSALITPDNFYDQPTAEGNSPPPSYSASQVPTGLSFHHHHHPVTTTAPQYPRRASSLMHFPSLAEQTAQANETDSLAVAKKLVEGPSLPKSLRNFSKFLARFVILCRGGSDYKGGFSPNGEHLSASCPADSPVSPVRSERSGVSMSQIARLCGPREKEFAEFVEMVLNTTDVNNIKHDGKSDKLDFIAGILLANKVLDDHTFTNRTWSDLSHIPIEEINRVELLTIWRFQVEYLNFLQHRTVLQRDEYNTWVQKIQRAFKVMSEGRVPPLLDPFIQKAKSDAEAEHHQAEMAALAAALHLPGYFHSPPGVPGLPQQFQSGQAAQLASLAASAAAAARPSGILGHSTFGGSMHVPSSVEALAAAAAEPSLTQMVGQQIHPSAYPKPLHNNGMSLPHGWSTNHAGAYNTPIDHPPQAQNHYGSGGLASGGMAYGSDRIPRSVMFEQHQQLPTSASKNHIDLDPFAVDSSGFQDLGFASGALLNDLGTSSALKPPIHPSNLHGAVGSRPSGNHLRSPTFGDVTGMVTHFSGEPHSLSSSFSGSPNTMLGLPFFPNQPNSAARSMHDSRIPRLAQPSPQATTGTNNHRYILGANPYHQAQLGSLAFTSSGQPQMGQSYHYGSPSHQQFAAAPNAGTKALNAALHHAPVSANQQVHMQYPSYWATNVAAGIPSNVQRSSQQVAAVHHHQAAAAANMYGSAHHPVMIPPGF